MKRLRFAKREGIRLRGAAFFGALLAVAFFLFLVSWAFACESEGSFSLAGFGGFLFAWKRRSPRRMAAVSSKAASMISEWERVADSLIVFDGDGRVLEANEKASELCGRSPGELPGLDLRELLVAAGFGAGPIPFASLEPGVVLRSECRVEHAEFGSRCYELLMSRLDRDRFRVFIHDIKGRKSAEFEMLKAKVLLESALEQCPVGILLSECPTGRTLYTNKAAAEMLKASQKWLLELDLEKIKSLEERFYEIDGSVCPIEELPIYKVVEKGEASAKQLIIHYKDGAERTLAISAAPLRDPAGAVFAAVCAIADIGAEIKAKALLKKRTDLLNTIIENVNVGILMVGPDLRITAYNRRLVEMSGLPESLFLGHPVVDRFIDFWRETAKPDQEVLDRVRRDLLRRDSFVREFQFGGRVLEYRHSPLPDGGFVRTFTDITERKKAEEDRIRDERAMLHTQKLESLGILAGGIAHDFNNLLLAILGNLELAKSLAGESGEEMRKRLLDAEGAAKRASDLTRQLLAYSGKGKLQLKNFDLTAMVSEMASLLNVSIAKNAELTLRLEKSLPPVKGDPAQVQQVIMNLIVNASEALEGRQGKIAISTGVSAFSTETLSKTRLDCAPPPGQFVFVEVKDDGCGMDEETEKRIFEPFYTTKIRGRGLGMSAVQGIMRSHGGAILLDSVKGKGSSFKMLFPAAEALAAHQDVSPESARSAAAPPSKQLKGCVMIVDDERMIRELCANILKKYGLRIILASGGSEAIELLSAHGAAIDCVLLDVSMPGMDGPETFVKLRELKPDLKIALSSGHSIDDVAASFEGLSVAGFIQKPFQIDSLRDEVERILKS